MVDRTVENERDRHLLVRLIEGQALPFTASIVSGKHRTAEQNRLQRLWVSEIADQLADTFESREHVRGYCKLHFGIPILRNENEAFKVKYDAVVKPLSYESKIKLMMIPFDFGVTRIMNTKQKTSYLDTVWREFSARGVELTDPEHEGRNAA